jgi:hypothetical protein
MAEHESQSVSALIQSVVADARELVRQEIALARAELREEITAVQSAGMSFSAAGLLGLIAVMLFCVALGGGIAWLLNAPTWVGYGIVALLLAGAAYFFLSRGRTAMANVHMLPKTTESLRENLTWIQSKSSRR